LKPFCGKQLLLGLFLGVYCGGAKFHRFPNLLDSIPWAPGPVCRGAHRTFGRFAPLPYRFFLAPKAAAGFQFPPHCRLSLYEVLSSSPLLLPQCIGRYSGLSRCPSLICRPPSPHVFPFGPQIWLLSWTTRVLNSCMNWRGLRVLLLWTRRLLPSVLRQIPGLLSPF